MVRPQRDRGPTVLERKAAEEAVAAKAEEEKRAARARKDAVCGDGPRRSSVAGAVSMSPVGACLLGRGRAARNAPLRQRAAAFPRCSEEAIAGPGSGVPFAVRC